MPQTRAATPPSPATKQFRFNGQIYTVPADATDDEITEAVNSQGPAATPPATGLFAGAASELAPIVNAVRHPIDTARGIPGMVAAFPAALREASAATPGMPLNASVIGRALTKPSLDNITERAVSGDTSGAVGAGLTAMATNWLPLSGASGAVGAGMRRAGRGIAGLALNAPPAEAAAVLKQNLLSRGVASGARRADGLMQAAADRAVASVPDDLRMPGAEARAPAAPPRTIFLADEAPGQAAPAAAAPAPSPRRTPWAGQSPADVIQYAEDYRKGGLSAATTTPRGNLGVTKQLNQATRNRARAAEVLPSEGQAALAEIDALQGPARTLAHAQSTGQRFLGIPTSWRGLAQTVGAQGAAGWGAQRLTNNAGLTSEAMAQMQRAALLARLMGQDDDEQR